MRLTALKSQKIVFILNVVFVIGLFFSTVIYTTSFYETYLYGDAELINFYTGYLQEYNKTIFNYSLVLILLLVPCILVKPHKYYPTFITFPILAVIMIVGVVLGILCVTQMKPVMNFYETYNYMEIPKLAEYKINYFFPIFTKFCGIGLAIVNLTSLGVYTFGLVKYMKGRGEQHD